MHPLGHIFDQFSTTTFKLEKETILLINDILIFEIILHLCQNVCITRVFETTGSYYIEMLVQLAFEHIPNFRKFKFVRVCSLVGVYFYNVYIVKKV